MKNTKQIKIQVAYVALTLIFAGFFYISGCGNDTVTNNQQTGPDTNVVVYDTLIITSQINSGAADLYNGKILTYSNTQRDVQLYNVNAQNINYLLRDGTFITPLGYECLFKLMYTGNDKFDTVSVIPGGLEVSNFPDHSTQNFNATTGQHMVLGFYLKGKFENGVTPHQVFGVLYLMSGSAGFNGFTEFISVRINKDGQNHFVK